jgi:hypothetical protein
MEYITYIWHEQNLFLSGSPTRKRNDVISDRRKRGGRGTRSEPKQNELHTMVEAIAEVSTSTGVGILR